MTAQDNSARADQNGDAAEVTGEPADDHLTEAKRAYEHALDHHRAGRIEEAIKDYALVVRLSPLSADVYNNLGVALRAAGRAHAAVACYRRSLALKPGVAGVYTNLGNALNDQGEAARAVEAHRRAVKFAPKSPKALLGAGVALRNVGQAAAALDHFNQAIKLEPTYALCRVEHAMTLLQMGDWQRGFKELEIRFALPGRDPRRKDLALWNGSPLKGETILINFEGSMGTVVQFARFASTLKHMNANVVMECPAHLAHLLSAAPDIAATLHPGAPLSSVPDHLPPVSAQIPLLSLPARLGVEVDKLPADSTYLSVPKFGGTMLDIHPETRLAVGLVWSGSWDGRPVGGPASAQDMALEDFDEILGVPGLQVFSLERGAGAGDITRLGLHPLIQPVGASLMDAADLAVVIDQLDLIICVDSPTAHIAGALGKPVWMLSGPGADWCWLLDRTDSPWYPSMRLFRREPTERWTDTVTHVRKALMDVLKGGA